MIPVLYKGNETNFNHNGIGLLKDTLTCEVTEVRNGTFDLELVYPVTGPFFKDLVNNNIIRAKPNDKDEPHNFRISEVDKTMSEYEVTIYASTITNDLGGNLVKELSVVDSTPQVILNEMKKVLHYSTPFNFVSNITTIGSVNWELNNPLNLLVGEEGSLVDIFGGEIKRTDNTVYLYGRRGHDNVTTIRYAKNLQGFKMTENFQGKFTQILPYYSYEEEIKSDTAKDGETSEGIRQPVTIFGKIVSSKHHGKYPVNNIRPIDMSNIEQIRTAVEDLRKDLEEKKVKNSLLRETIRTKVKELVEGYSKDYFTKLNPGCDEPSINMSIDLLQLVDSEQYEYWKRLEEIELCDTVSVYIPQYDVDVLVKISTLKYDSLRERTISIVAGSSQRTSLMDEVSGQYKEFTKQAVNDAVQNATAGIVNTVLAASDGTQLFTGKVQPTDGAKVGDIWFKDVGDGEVEMWKFDGVNWVRNMYKGFGDDIKQIVDDAVNESKTQLETAISVHDKTIKNVMSSVDDVRSIAGNASSTAQQSLQESRNASALARQTLNDITAKTGQAEANAVKTARELYNSLNNNLSTRITHIENDNGTQTRTIEQLNRDKDSLTTKINSVEQSVGGFNAKLEEVKNTIPRRIGGDNILLNTRSKFVMGYGIPNTTWDEARKVTRLSYGSNRPSISFDEILPQTTDSNFLLYKELDKGARYTMSIKVGTDAMFSPTDVDKLKISLFTREMSHEQIQANIEKISDNLYLVWTSFTYKHIQSNGNKFGVRLFDMVGLRHVLRFRESGSYIEFSDPKLEYGDFPTDYSQHPTEIMVPVETKIAEYKQTIDQNLSALTKTVSDSNKNVETFKTSVNQTVGSIRSEVSQIQQTAEQNKNALSTKIDQTAGAIRSEVNSFKSETSGKINTMTSKVTQLESSVSTKVSSTEVSGIIDRRTDLAKKTDITTSFDKSVLLSRMTTGTAMVNNPMFKNIKGTGFTDIRPYNNSSGSNAVTVTRTTENVGQKNGGYVQKIAISSTGDTTPNFGGFYISPMDTKDKQHFRHGAEIVIRFIAKLPANYTFNLNNNQIGDQARAIWLTSNSGKGTWETYIAHYKFGSTGTISEYALSYISVKGPSKPVTFYLQDFEMYDISIAREDVDLSGYVTSQTFTSYANERKQTDRQTTELIQQTVSKVPTGPVNLIKNGFDQQNTEYWGKGGNSTLTSRTHSFFYNSSKKLLVLSTSGTTEVFAYTNVFNIKRNTKYTLRLGLFNNSNVNGCDIYLMRRTTGGSWNYLKINDGKERLSVSHVEYYTFTVSSDAYDEAQFRIDNNGSKTNGSGADLYICEVSCIEGEMNNSWSPSFDELITEQKFNETKSTVDSFVRAIGTREQNGIIPAISRQIITQDAFVTEVSKYGQHVDNLIVDSQKFSVAEEREQPEFVVKDGVGGFSFHKSGMTSYKWAGIFLPTYVTNYQVGETYTLSLDVKVLSNIDEGAFAEFKDISNGKQYALMEIAPKGAVSGDWKHISKTVTMVRGTSPNTTKQGLYIWLNKNGGIAIRNLMLVKGDKIGPYSPSRNDTLSTRVEQTANSYAIKSIRNQNDIVSQINVTNSGLRLKSSLIHLDGNVTFSNSAFIPAATIKDLSASHIKTGTLDASKVNITNLNVNSVTGITQTFLKSIIGDAWIDWMRGKMITAYNGNMTIDLNGGNVILKTGSNAIKRVSSDGVHTGFLHFADDKYGGIYASIGVTSSGDGVKSDSGGRFSGIRAFRASNGRTHEAKVDQLELYGDKIVLSDDFNLNRGLIVQPTAMTKEYKLHELISIMQFFARVYVHLSNVGGDWHNRDFNNAFRNEYNANRVADILNVPSPNGGWGFY